MTLTLLHTADVHCGTFDELAARIAPDVTLVHHVHVDWLVRAKDGIDSDLKEEIADLLRTADGPVICTCTSLGEIAGAFGAIRIDQPMMSQAAAIGGPILLAFSVESTRKPSTGLLAEEIKQAGQMPNIHPLFLGVYWPLFLAGDNDAFHRAIADAVRKELHTRVGITSVVLAQASMAGAAMHLGDVKIPVLTAPELAFRAALKRL